MDGRTVGWMDHWMDHWMDCWLDGWLDRWMDVWMGACVYISLNVCMYVCTYVCVYIYIHIHVYIYIEHMSFSVCLEVDMNAQLCCRKYTPDKTAHLHPIPPHMSEQNNPQDVSQCQPVLPALDCKETSPRNGRSGLDKALGPCFPAQRGGGVGWGSQGLSNSVGTSHCRSFCVLFCVAGSKVICDEAHVMRTISTLLGKAVRRLKADCRILLTGTPVAGMKLWHGMWPVKHLFFCCWRGLSERLPSHVDRFEVRPISVCDCSHLTRAP